MQSFLEVFTIGSIGTILFLVFMEGILSLDNALVLALLVRPLPHSMQKKALTYGIAGAFGFRFLSLFFISHLMEMHWLKVVGGAYLLYIAGKHFLSDEEDEEAKVRDASTMAFWRVILTVELMDIAFSADSILASVALSPNYYVVFAGGVLGIIMMRVASTMFVKLLDKFPGLEETAFMLITTIGVKLCVQGWDQEIDFNSSSSPAFWIFWGAMILSVVFGFLQKKETV